jgi:hypothetical protein
VIRVDGVVREPFARAAQAPIHEADIAAVVVTALLQDGHAGRRYTLSGPASLTKTEQVEAISGGLDRQVSFEEVSPTLWLTVAGVDPDVAEFLVARWAAATDHPEPVLPTVREVTGRPARTLIRWAADHAEEFGASANDGTGQPPRRRRAVERGSRASDRPTGAAHRVRLPVQHRLAGRVRWPAGGRRTRSSPTRDYGPPHYPSDEQ